MFNKNFNGDSYRFTCTCKQYCVSFIHFPPTVISCKTVRYLVTSCKAAQCHSRGSGSKDDPGVFSQLYLYFSVCVCVGVQHYHGAGSCIHHHSQDTEQFITIRILFCLPFISTSASLLHAPCSNTSSTFLQSLTPGNSKLLYSHNFVISKRYINETYSVVAFWIALFTQRNSLDHPGSPNSSFLFTAE